MLLVLAAVIGFSDVERSVAFLVVSVVLFVPFRLDCVEVNPIKSDVLVSASVVVSDDSPVVVMVTPSKLLIVIELVADMDCESILSVFWLCSLVDVVVVSNISFYTALLSAEIMLLVIVDPA